MTETLTPIPQTHTSPETAYVVDDYPYGFRLRCKIRYWIEHHPKHGFRLVSQTTNPKLSREVWNKPKASIYSAVVLVMGLDEQGHVQSAGIGPYNLDELKAFNAKWAPYYNDAQREKALRYEWQCNRYEELKAQGMSIREASARAVIEYHEAHKGERSRGEPHVIVVKVWHNARWHDVKYVPITSAILDNLFHENPNEYYNPTPQEWDELSDYILPDR